MKIQQKGFTLVELIVVIVILGILAATALPRFVNLQGDARSASMKGLSGSARAAVELIRGKWLATGSSGSTSVDPGGGAPAVTVNASGFPAAAAGGIDNALNLSTGSYNFSHAAGVSTIRPGSDTTTACAVTYTAASGAVDDTAATAAACQ